MISDPRLRKYLEFFLEEDIGFLDLTSSFFLNKGKKAKALVKAKEDLILCGSIFIKPTINIIDPLADVYLMKSDGSLVKKGEEIAIIEADTYAILCCERTILNIIQRLSGIATLTNRMQKLISHTKARLCDTRKTTPGMRPFEKYAVKTGGAVNHRYGLFDSVLIKDNHIHLFGSIKEAVYEIKKLVPFTTKIEVEVKNLSELEEALKANADIIMLDNFSTDEIKEAVNIAGGKAVLEASGGITPDNILEVAETGVDFISSGFITHHAQWLDINMKVIS